uniref:UDP-glucuronosyltransferase n=1 Tax=Lygus hesperus TaxID=30085 RepID=A0A146L0V5_LYGHE
MFFHVLLLLLWSVEGSQCLRILVYNPVSWRSHQFVFRGLIRGLGDKGHLVDFYTPLPMPDPPETVNQVKLHDALEEVLATVDVHEFENCWPLRNMEINYEATSFMIQKTAITGKAFTELLSSNRTYDIVITEFTLWSEPLSYLAHRFDALNVVFTPLLDHPWTNELAGLPDNPSYMMSFQSKTNGKSFAFYERLKNTFKTFSQIFGGHRQLATRGQEIADAIMRYEGWENRPKLSEMARDAALILLNTHPSMSYPYPRAPHVKEVGGMHITEPEPLPKDLQEFMDNSPEGVIYFSLGTNVDAKAQTEQVFDVLVNVFKTVNQKVLWKVGPGMPEVKENTKIKMQTWFPQQDILAHENLVLFITHGGLQSTVEAINYGVPILGMPIWFDQFKDIEFLTSTGMGLRLNFDNITEETLSWSINEIITNPRYREQAKKRQSMFRDRPMKPVDEAIYWIEYVARHGKVLQPASVHLPFYQLYLLDIIGTIIVGLLSTLYLVRKVVRSVSSLCYKNMVQKSKKNQ